jgi:hypothetical protein
MLLGAVAGSAATLGLLYLFQTQSGTEVSNDPEETIGNAHVIPVTGGSSVHIGSQLVDLIPKEILRTKHGKKATKFVIVSDETVFRLHGARLVSAFAALGITQKPTGPKQLVVYQIKPGEKSKSRKVKEDVEDTLIAKGCKRDTVMVALGGGVVGDLTGFVAATFMRGVPVVQVHTSLNEQAKPTKNQAAPPAIQLLRCTTQNNPRHRQAATSCMLCTPCHTTFDTQIPTSVMAMVDSSVGGKTAVNVPAGKNLVRVT